MSNLLRHAEQELDLYIKLEKDPKESLIAPFKDEILALVKKFGQQGHSGGSAPYGSSALQWAIKTLLAYKPLAPVMGTDDEWGEVSGDILQNKRYSAIFKHPSSGKCTYNDAIVWKTQNGSCWSGAAYLPDGRKIHSSAVIKAFPFTPKTFYIDIIEEEVAPDDWKFTIKNVDGLKQLEELYELEYITLKTEG